TLGAGGHRAREARLPSSVQPARRHARLERCAASGRALTNLHASRARTAACALAESETAGERYTAPVTDDANRLLTVALEDLGVACAVLDAELAIVEATPSADLLTDGALVRGMSIVKAICGDAPQRPIAEALAAGRSASGAVIKPDPSGVMRTLEV